MISQTAQYALRAMAFLASRNGGSCTVQDMAAATSMPAGFLSKVLQELTRAKLVKSQRGPLGGFRLAKEASRISVLSVFEAICPLQRIHECPLNLPEHKNQLCALHRLLDDALASVEKAFRQASVADLLGVPSGPGVLCPRVADSIPQDLRNGVAEQGQKPEVGGQKSDGPAPSPDLRNPTSDF